jgi:glycosyltransferase involved in cell wall biosynthesis
LFPRYSEFPVFDGIDWYWGASLLRGLRFIRAQRPDVVLLQWWTIGALHTYLVLAWVCKRRRLGVVIEFHELQDPAESTVRGAAWLNKQGLRLLVGLASAVVVHNRHDQRLIEESIPLRGVPVSIVPHGPYDHLAGPRNRVEPDRRRDSTEGKVTRLLFFGLIRRYKGLEDLIEAFSGLDTAEAQQFELIVVGETWEGWTLPSKLVNESPHRQRITFVNRYVTDPEVQEYFAAADALVLPYRRASSSGPLSIGLAAGLPIVLYEVPALVDTLDGYEGAIVVGQGDVVALRNAIRSLPALAGRRFAPHGSWADITKAYREVLNSVASS